MTKQNPAPPSFTPDQQGGLAAPWGLPTHSHPRVSPGRTVPGWFCRGSSLSHSLPGQGTGWQRLLWAGAEPQRCRKKAKVLWCSGRHVAVPPHRQRPQPRQGLPDLSLHPGTAKPPSSCATSHKKEERKNGGEIELYFCSSRAGRAPLRCRSPGDVLGCGGSRRRRRRKRQAPVSAQPTAAPGWISPKGHRELSPASPRGETVSLP